ncbi:hypothetical protein KFK09_028524 [Dendrobium nobile]|uniref:Uncharacterized protein n=1 Tax=Dendrobium nobile TaxID=94219 RepID=A0A8T3A1T4_DENNO|nr:hypothetical protein KFK09_028524 [Dendrobium nobile]
MLLAPPPRPAASFSSASLLSRPCRLAKSLVHTTSIVSSPLRPRIHPFPSLLSLSPSVSTRQLSALPADEQSEMVKLAQLVTNVIRVSAIDNFATNILLGETEIEKGCKLLIRFMMGGILPTNAKSQKISPNINLILDASTEL